MAIDRSEQSDCMQRNKVIYAYLTSASLNVPLPNINVRDALYIYGLAAFDVVSDRKLNVFARSGFLFSQLRRLFLVQENNRVTSILLNALLNSFFFMENTWVKFGKDNVEMGAPAELEIAAVASLDEARRGTNPSNMIIRSAIAHIEGNHEECARLLQAMITLDSLEDPIPECHYGAFTYRPPTRETFDNIRNLSSIETKVHFVTDASRSPYPIVVCAVDPIYFKVYAQNLLASMGVREKYAIHFHIVNPDDECLSLHYSLTKAYHGLAIGLSIEHSSNVSRSYYASARFLRAAELLEFLESDMCILDADISFSVRPKLLLEGLQRFDCALLKRDGYPAYLPWRTVGAGAAFFKWSEGGRHSAGLIQGCIKYLLDEYHGDPAKSWWVDQNALFLASELMREKRMKFGVIPRPFISQLNHNYAANQRLLDVYLSGRSE